MFLIVEVRAGGENRRQEGPGCVHSCAPLWGGATEAVQFKEDAVKMFLDTANVTQLREGVAMGLVDGCTTNPSLIAKEKRPFRPLVEEICQVVPGDGSLEEVAT